MLAVGSVQPEYAAVMGGTGEGGIGDGAGGRGEALGGRRAMEGKKETKEERSPEVKLPTVPVSARPAVCSASSCRLPSR